MTSGVRTIKVDGVGTFYFDPSKVRKSGSVLEGVMLDPEAEPGNKRYPVEIAQSSDGTYTWNRKGYRANFDDINSEYNQEIMSEFKKAVAKLIQPQIGEPPEAIGDNASGAKAIAIAKKLSAYNSGHATDHPAQPVPGGNNSGQIGIA